MLLTSFGKQSFPLESDPIVSMSHHNSGTYYNSHSMHTFAKWQKIKKVVMYVTRPQNTNNSSLREPFYNVSSQCHFYIMTL